jgi:hypothetical protein
MAQVTFSGSSGTIPNLNQNFTQLYDWRELVTTPSYSAATPKFYVDANGNWGIGQTPAAWGASFRALHLPLAGIMTQAVGGVLYMMQGVYYDGTNYRYQANGFGTEISLLGSDGSIRFAAAPTGLAGAVATLTYYMKLDASGNWLQIGSGGIGYGTGSGGAVTQATSKSTGVTLNKSNGAITMHNASLAATTSVSFTFSNSLIVATDCVVISIKSGATQGAYLAQVDTVTAGACVITLRNYTGGALAEAVVLNFAVIKAVTS